MNKKIIILVLCGVLAAGLLCLIVGLIVYDTAKTNVLSLIIGLYAIISGIIIAAAALIALLVTVTVILILRAKNKDK
ncbi:MAG: hypothetical protein NC131_02015 [Roseburia sp.]|nr:hypothetical protein [Roseburia sp.]